MQEPLNRKKIGRRPPVIEVQTDLKAADMNRINFVKSVWTDMLTRGGIEQVLFNNLKIVSAEPNKVIAHLPLERKHTNRLGIVHGGVLSTLVDVGGSLACAANGMFMTGVTTDLSATYLSAGGKPGDILQIDCLCQRLGRQMAYTFVELRDPATQKLLARGNHTKYVANAWKSDQNVKFPE